MAFSVIRSDASFCRLLGAQRTNMGVGQYSENGFNLGGWVDHQRQREQNIDPERRKQLNTFGFIWDTHIDGFEDGIVALKKYLSLENNCRIPATHVEDKFKLGKWAQIQRQNKYSMPIDRRHLLGAMGFDWDGFDNLWEEGVAALKMLKSREGHCRVPRHHREQNFRLGQWVKEQRKSGRAMPANRWQLLDDIGFVWHPLELEWEEAFLPLSKYRAHEGHCRVPSNHIKGTIKLGIWVKGQQNRKSKNADRNRRLEEIGFDWNVK